MTSTPAPAPRKAPTMATMRAALKKAGRTPAEDTPKAVKAAWLALQDQPATPTPAKTTPAPRKGKPAKAPAPTPAAKTAPGSFPLCGCGCGVPTVTAKARFLSGHDARLAGVLGRAWSANPGDEAIEARVLALTPALQAKVAKVKATADRKVAEKAARAKAREAAAAAYAAALKG